MMCNHSKLITPFCPECGERILFGPQAELRHYLHLRITELVRRQRYVAEWVAKKDAPDAPDAAEKFAKVARSITKYQSWLDFVTTALPQERPGLDL